MAAVQTAEPRTYGNFRRPESPGIGNLGTLGTALVFGGLIVLIVLLAARFVVAALIWVTLVGSVLLLLMVKDRHGQTGVQRLGTRLGWWRTRKLGQHLYRSGPLARTDHGNCQLPGVLAASRLHEYADSYGRPFGFLEMPQVGHFSVVIAAEPDGAALVDQDQVDSWVAHWGHFLAGLGQELGIVGASVTVETAPDTGARLRREVLGRIKADAPPLAQQMLREVTATYPHGSAQVRAWISLTFDGHTYSDHRPHSGSGRRRDVDEVARDLGARLPSLTQQLAATGAGAARPATAQQLCEVVRTAYDPATAVLIDDARSTGETPLLDWSDVGPTATEASWDWLRHDGAWSRTWMMTAAPRGVVPSSVLGALLGPHSDIDRKRVTLVYRPLDAAKAAQTVEQDKRNADFRVASSTRPSARALTGARSASAVAAEEARGAGLVDFGVLVTATVTDEHRLGEVRATIDNLTAGARLVTRPVYGSQDSAFAAALPLGLVLPSHLRVPTAVRGAM